MRNKISIRKAEIPDIEQIKIIEADSGLSYWSSEDYKAETSRADSHFYVASNRNSKIKGYILARLITISKFEIENNDFSSKNKKLTLNKNSNDENFNDEYVERYFELYNIAVDKEFRREGIATVLLNKLVDAALAKKAEYVSLEVRKSNEAAKRLYKRFGFELIFERKNFYNNPPEDGLVLKLNIRKTN